MRNMFATKGIDTQKLRDEGQRRFEKEGEKTLIHFHSFGQSCEDKAHEEVPAPPKEEHEESPSNA